MSKHLHSVLGLSAFCGALAVMPANAATTSRVTNFLIQCDGTNKTVTLNFPGFLPNINQFVVGAEITLFENRGGLQFLLLKANGDAQRQILSIGIGENRAQVIFPTQLGPYPGFGGALLFGSIIATGNAQGIVPFTIDGACSGGFGQVQGNVTVWFAAGPN
jgi:hypothetical protein